MDKFFSYMDDFIYYYAWSSLVLGILLAPVKIIYDALFVSKDEDFERSMANFNPLRTILVSLSFLSFLHFIKQNQKEVEQLKQRIEILESTCTLVPDSCNKIRTETNEPNIIETEI